MRAVELLRNNFGVSQLYKHEVKAGDETLLEIYWHPLTIAERESIQKKSGTDDAGDFALSLMIEKASILQEIQLAMLTSGSETKVEEAKAALKS
jgi:hypothetical protein